MVFETFDRAVARHEFRKHKSALMRERGGKFLVFAPATEAIGHPTTESYQGRFTK